MKYDPMTEQPLKSARFKSLIHFATRAKSQSADHVESADFKDVEFFVRPREEIIIRHRDPAFEDVVVPIENVACYVVGYTDRFPAASPEVLELIEQGLPLPWDDVTPGLHAVIDRVAAASAEELPAPPPAPPDSDELHVKVSAAFNIVPPVAIATIDAEPANAPAPEKLTKAQRKAAAKLAKASE